MLAAIHTVSVEDFVAARDEIHEDRNTHRGAATHREVTPAHVNSVNVCHFLGVRECKRIFAGPHFNGAVTALLMGFALIILFQMVFFLHVLGDIDPDNHRLLLTVTPTSVEASRRRWVEPGRKWRNAAVVAFA